MRISVPVTNISKGSLHDGPGVRTVVYLKGCGLHCRWCHNPETISPRPQILYIKSKCIHCGSCVALCPEHHKISGNDMEYIKEGCVACGKCAEVCPSSALELCGKTMDSDEIFAEIKKDFHYYKASGGGVTFSGGECLLYPDFIVDIAKKCREEGIHTAVESAFLVPWKNVEKVIPYIDLFFVDLKIPAPEKHREYTGQDNRLIIVNIRALSKIHDNIILRIPVIPGVNDSNEDMDAFASIISSFGEGIKETELLKYNHLASSKYEIAGEKYERFSESPQKDEEMKALCSILEEKSGTKCFFV